MTRYRTTDGDTLDWICWKHYGRASGAVETVLAANPGLSARGAVYDAGMEIILPDITPPPQRKMIRLWE
jgi:phage tail protein X